MPTSKDPSEIPAGAEKEEATELSNGICSHTTTWLLLQSEIGPSSTFGHHPEALRILPSCINCRPSGKTLVTPSGKGAGESILAKAGFSRASRCSLGLST
eukprot:scaffold149527_cov30-Tisochrysis_lutea.AAC.6